MFLRIFVFISAIFLMAVGSVQAQTELVVPGTGDSQALLRILAAEFNKNNPDYNVVIPDSVGSGGGVKAAGKGQNEMGRVARPIKEREKKYNLEYTVFASSPVVFALNGNINVSSLTAAQIISIFNGSIKNWSEIGGKDKKILVINREKGDSSRSVLEKKLPGFKEVVKFAGDFVYSTPKTIETIRKFDGSVGYVPLPSVIASDLTIFNYENINPRNTIEQRKYPLVTPFGLVWKKGGLSAGMAKFKDYLFTKNAQKIISGFGAIPAE